MNDNDKALIAQAKELSHNCTLWYKVDVLVDKADAEETKRTLTSISKRMYHREMFSNDF